MRKYDLRALIYKGFKISTTNSKHSNRIYPNLTYSFEVTHPNQLWVTDITYIRIGDGFVFLSVILDIFSRKVVGWSISKQINVELPEFDTSFCYSFFTFNKNVEFIGIWWSLFYFSGDFWVKTVVTKIGF